ncbi:baseplate J/gp47 family protein [Candidatus Pacearchaeota archaeon]|nr:baseplate J/gp47 family protein [Candidatus Pacearchaeota archaeon]
MTVEITESWPDTEQEVIDQFIFPVLVTLGENYVNDRGDLTVAGNLFAQIHAQFMLWMMDQIDDGQRATVNSERLYFNQFLGTSQGNYTDVIAEKHFDTPRDLARKTIQTQSFTRGDTLAEEILPAGFEVQAIVLETTLSVFLIDPITFAIGEATKEGSVEAENVGDEYNLSAGQFTIMPEPDFITETTNTAITQTGRFKESDESLINSALLNFRSKGYAQDGFYESVINDVTGYDLATEQYYFKDNSFRNLYGGGHFVMYILSPTGVPSVSIIDSINQEIAAEESYQVRALSVPDDLAGNHGLDDFPFAIAIPEKSVNWIFDVVQKSTSTKTQAQLTTAIEEVIEYMRRENEAYKPDEGEEETVFQFTPNVKYYKLTITGTIREVLDEDIDNITIDNMTEFSTGSMQLAFEIPDLSAIVVNHV